MTPLFDPDTYRRALEFAAKAHLAQRVPGTELPYVVHVTAVCAEVLAALSVERWEQGERSVVCALLHDTIEDTDRTWSDVASAFGDAVADGVAALSKNPALPKPAAMADSLERIRYQPRAVWCVKLADRIVNLADPPHYWTPEKIAAYRAEAVTIADALGDASPALHARLRAKIEAYGR
jgi:(p)ppGpp synthase/HD superfamily hydrolase